MTMPEAPVRKEHCFASLEDEVWAAGQRPIMETKTEAPRMQALAKEELWFRVESPDAGHHPASNLRAYDISHSARERVR